MSAVTSRIAMMVWVLLLTSMVATAEPPRIEYTIDVRRPTTQLIEMSMRISGLAQADRSGLDIALPTWRPGRYEILDSAGAIQDVSATSGDGAALTLRKTTKSVWRLDPAGHADVVVRWTVFANELNRRTRHMDDSHAFISPCAVCFYLPKYRDAPVLVRITAAPDWSVATGLSPQGDDPRVLYAASYDVLVDSPIEIGVHDRLTFEVDGVAHEIVIWGDAVYSADRLTEDFTTIIRSQADMFGVMPYDRYVFIIHIGGRGGTEHLNSTVMQTSRRALEGSRDNSREYKQFLGLVSHEMFHTWNVKQLRPACIHPYDYQRENYCELFWVAEGTTSYYDDLVLARSGLITPKEYFDIVSGMADGLRRRPGRTVQSLSSSSFDAWIKYNQPNENAANSTVSFYTKGALVSLLLDMRIRAETDNAHSLDELMRRLFEQYPLSGPGFTTSDLITAAEAMCGCDLAPFFRDFVDGVADLNYADLNVVGMELIFKHDVSEDSDVEAGDVDTGTVEDVGSEDESGEGGAIVQRGELGMFLVDRGGRPVVRRLDAGGPAMSSGLMLGDEIIAMNGRRLAAADLEARLKDVTPGDTVALTLFRRDVVRTIDVVAAARPAGQWRIQRISAPTDAQRAAYAQWLGQPWPEDDGQ